LAEQAMGNAAGRDLSRDGYSGQMCHVYASARVSRDAGVAAAEQDRCRGLALAWLRFELDRQRANARTVDPNKWLTARRMVRFWQQHRDLAPLCGAAALARLPEAERADWSRFRGEVDDLVCRIDAAGPPARAVPLE
jgi:hypothetical protein